MLYLLVVLSAVSNDTNPDSSGEDSSDSEDEQSGAAVADGSQVVKNNLCLEFSIVLQQLRMADQMPVELIQPITSLIAVPLFPALFHGIWSHSSLKL